MPAFILTADADAPARYLIGGADTMIVVATDATEARLVAKAMDGRDNDAMWANADVTQIAAATDWATPTLWNFKITLSGGITVTVQSSLTNNTVDEIAALLVTALNATAINAAAYNSSTNVLKVAAIADGIGDQTFTAVAWPELSTFTAGVNVGSFFGAHVEGGIAAADLTVQLIADAGEVPNVAAFYTFKSV